MTGARTRSLLALMLAAAITVPLLTAVPAEAGSPTTNPAECERAPGVSPGLPSVTSGARPGPATLYQPPPAVPELSNAAPFTAAPLLVSGTDAYRRGEYLYQDYLFDDHGADTVSQFPSNADDLLSDSSGDVAYPTGTGYAGNAADIVEMRIKPTPDAIVYRVTLNTVVDADAAMVGIGIDTDRSGGAPVAWPGGAGVATPGLDRFITAWGTGGQVHVLPGDEPVALPPGAVTLDTGRNQLTIRVPRSLMDPGAATWRYVAGAGLRDGAGRWAAVPAADKPTSTSPASGNKSKQAPAVFNLAFRFEEPQRKVRLSGGQNLGVGVWSEDGQAGALGKGSTGGFFADVEFSALASGAERWAHAPGQTQTRIHASRLDVPEGIRPDGEFGMFGGRLQPYVLRVPASCDPRRPAGLTLALHGAQATHTQWSVFSPNYLQQLGDERGNFVLSPLKRSTCCYQPEWYADIFEAWADVAHRFPIDPDRVTLSGYSAGGYDSYRLGIEYPDLFGYAFPIVGGAFTGADAIIPGNKTNYLPMIGNARWLPYLAWHGVLDETGASIGAVLTQKRFNELGLRNQLWSFPAADHFVPGLLDQWQASTKILGEAPVAADPGRVDYGIAPVTWDPARGLVADHAYWVSGLRIRDPKLLDQTKTARGYVTANSRAFGQGDPPTRTIVGAYAGLPGPAVITGTGWGAIPRVPARNAIEVDLRNLHSVQADGIRARLDGTKHLTVQIRSDGAAEFRLALPLPPGTTVTRTDGAPVTGVTVTTRGAVFTTSKGTVTYLLTPRQP